MRRGETLYAIAWRYGSDYRALARVNGIRPPYTIYPGQTLRLRGTPAATSRASRAPTKPHVTKPKAGPSSKPKHSPTTSTAPVAAWQWPVRGKVIGGFGRGGGKGIDIAGRSGQTIAASAGGRVVYSGSGLRGYGKLIIIKHNDRYLSAYAHNKKLHVKEGDKVQRGQRIAEMGSSETDRVKLHFEIRRDGKPVDPLKHLPG